MTKERKESLKQDPIRYQHYLKRKREQRKRKLERIKSDPDRLSLYKKKQKRYRDTRTKKNRIIRDERRSKSSYWQKSVYHRFCHKFFRQLAGRLNNRCKTQGRVTALQLYSIAKKQRMICPLTGEKLTRNNISLDHIKPVTHGGTNALDNLRFITKAANVAKHTMTDAELVKLCESILHNTNVSTNSLTHNLPLSNFSFDGK